MRIIYILYTISINHSVEDNDSPMLAILLWRSLAISAVTFGAAGVVLPGLPTVPFLILAAWSAGRGWPAMEVWLLEHPKYGDTIRNWRAHGAVPQRAKALATLMMLVSTTVIFLTPVPELLRWLLPPFLLLVALWLWSRPNE